MRIAIALAIAVGVAACSDRTPRAQRQRPLVPLAFDVGAGSPPAVNIAQSHRAARNQG
ncbi:hypothetical protein [Sphingomonas colocasiae]|uniref:Lipoprotein n=1 Tax=Sphingomonas colocasiae TaxID=1848973 RepID=A0ABS7PY86_9SPHN|nr:hypothetical protein [Sphingomonas colocasiae]MBY8826327.1 hypothetical protein [Sphingomonas colocasiae]